VIGNEKSNENASDVDHQQLATKSLSAQGFHGTASPNLLAMPLSQNPGLTSTWERVLKVFQPQRLKNRRL
jgi:hypothetical protein